MQRSQSIYEWKYRFSAPGTRVQPPEETTENQIEGNVTKTAKTKT